MARPYQMKSIVRAMDGLADGRATSMRRLARSIRWQQGYQGTGPLSCRSLVRTVGGNAIGHAFVAIDTAHPPGSVKQAYQRLGFPIGGGVTRLPHEPISLRAIARRIDSPAVVPVRLLSYNTYLLPGFRIPFGRWIDDTVGWDALSWFGIPFGGALLVTLGLASIPGIALATILEAAGFTPSRVIRTVTGIDLDGIASLGAKPALEQRARFLGSVLGIYDVCCLCEVCTDESRDHIRSRLHENSEGASFELRTGPDESGAWTLLSSGLLFLARSRLPIVKTERMVFADRGNKRKDSDAWANKGVLLNVIDLGFGRLELFQTHFYYGGGIEAALPVPLPGVSDPTDEERMNVWRAELDELAEFYRRHHDDANIAVITGDFNMSGSDVREYKEIRRVMDRLDLRDLWAWDVHDHNPSEGHTCRFTDGDKSGWNRGFGAVCDPAEQPDQRHPWNSYCNDRESHRKPPRGTGRYDYIFIGNPKASQRLRVEASRIVRRPFPLPNEIEAEQYLSDHLALELTLYCSPAG